MHRIILNLSLLIALAGCQSHVNQVITPSGTQIHGSIGASTDSGVEQSIGVSSSF